MATKVAYTQNLQRFSVKSMLEQLWLVSIPITGSNIREHDGYLAKDRPNEVKALVRKTVLALYENKFQHMSSNMIVKIFHLIG